MGYYVRAFCIDSKTPSLSSVLKWLEDRGRHIEIDQQATKVDLTSPRWEQAALIYKVGKAPILAECNRDDGTNESLLRQEIAEFLEFVGAPGLSLSKRTVVGHLKKTRFIIACQLATSDIDNDGYDANGDFLNFFVENCGAMVQADGEGFYKGNKLIVKLE